MQKNHTNKLTGRQVEGWAQAGGGRVWIVPESWRFDAPRLGLNRGVYGHNWDAYLGTVDGQYAILVQGVRGFPKSARWIDDATRVTVGGAAVRGGGDAR